MTGMRMRVRRYVCADGTSAHAYVERKVHHCSWTGEPSVKERFRLSCEEVGPFLAGALDLQARRAPPPCTVSAPAASCGKRIVSCSHTPRPFLPRLRVQAAVRDRMLSEGASAEDADHTLELAQSVSQFVQEQGLEFTLRTEYYRTAFQLNTSNAVRARRTDRQVGRGLCCALR